METLSITRALVEIKTLDKRITKTAENLQPVAVCIGGGESVTAVTGSESKEEFAKGVLASYQSLTALIDRRRKIKSAVVQSNAVTTISVAGENMTVAEAIERKNSIAMEKMIRDNLGQKYAEKIEQIERHNDAIQSQLFKLLEATYSKPEMEISKEDYDRVAVPFRENNGAELIDPLKIKNKLQELEEKIAIFEAEVDIALTESNARTDITI